jgi:hypothetical protein
MGAKFSDDILLIHRISNNARNAEDYVIGNAQPATAFVLIKIDGPIGRGPESFDCVQVGDEELA